jgi:shikimate dehydrogenase
MKDLTTLVTNTVERGNFPEFAAIIGVNPSKGARSPKLWNAAFAAHSLEAAMIPLDVEVAQLPLLLDALDADSAFIGGAVAAPYKEWVAHWLGARVSAPVAKIGAVNCLYRGHDGHLAGTNTDGEAALTSFEAFNGAITGRQALLLGAGGAGKAVAAYFSAALGRGGRLTISARSSTAVTFARELDAEWADWNHLDPSLENVDIVVNCTSIGWGLQSGQSPLSAEQLALLQESATVFDVIYQPRPTALLQMAARRGLRTFDGLAMNLEQAILAFEYAVAQSARPGVTRAAMQAAARNE